MSLGAIALLALWGGQPQGQGPSRIEIHGEIVYEDSCFDIDPATSLPRARAGNVAADSRSARHEGRLSLIPLNGAAIHVDEFKEVEEFDEWIKTNDLST